MKNTNLTNARNAKQDEFYTQFADIENELRHYREHFRGKTVFCNCDDPFESNFFRYFAANFHSLGLKKLIATGCGTSPSWERDLSFFNKPKATVRAVGQKTPFLAIITAGVDEDSAGRIGSASVRNLLKNPKNVLSPLKGDGDFRSVECVELLKQTDIVVTNPPFSLFREYVALLVEHKKKFLIIGNMNAITYKEIFPLIKDSRLWLGASIHSGDRKFHVPDDYPMDAATCGIDEEGRKFIRVKGVRWFTNLDFASRHEKLPLFRHYTPEEYPKYDNYEAIEIGRTADIPCDYDGVMGVPITFLDKYNPEQFEIVGMAKRGAGDPALRTRVYTKEDFPNYCDLNAGPVLWRNGVLKNTYPRVLIRKREYDASGCCR